MPPLIHQIPEMVMADTVQEQLFSLMSSNQTPFHGLSQWPWLDDLLQEHSQRILEQDGDDVWQLAGGRLNEQRQPTLDLQSDVVEQILQDVESGCGGLLWQDKNGVAWAMKLASIQHNNKRSRCGYGITWWRQHPQAFDPIERERRYDDAQTKCESTEELSRLAADLRLFRRAEQLLWLTHWQVLAQRSSLVMIPDISIAEVIWGEQSRWPRNWRRDIQKALRSLTGLHSEAVRFTGKGWQPQWQSHSVALAHVSFAPRNSENPMDCCPACCLLHGTGEQHGHYRIQVGYGFLGVLEKYMKDSTEDRRLYDFSRNPQGEALQELTEVRSEGRIVSTNLPLKLFGPASWSGLARRERNILSGLAREVSRPRNARRVFLVQNGEVAGRQPTRTVSCPFLDASKRYIVFGGNGHRHGLGYCIVGRSRTGWLSRCGYDCHGDNKAELRRKCRDWLAGLETLQGRLKLVLVGFVPSTNTFIDLAEMKDLARVKTGWDSLNQLHIRVYAPENYGSQLRHFLADQGGLTQIDSNSDDNPGRGFRRRLNRLGLTHQNLAEDLRVTRPYVTRLLNGDKWPIRRVQQVEVWLEAKESTA